MHGAQIRGAEQMVGWLGFQTHAHTDTAKPGELIYEANNREACLLANLAYRRQTSLRLCSLQHSSFQDAFETNQDYCHAASMNEAVQLLTPMPCHDKRLEPGLNLSSLIHGPMAAIFEPRAETGSRGARTRRKRHLRHVLLGPVLPHHSQWSSKGSTVHFQPMVFSPDH